MKLGLEVGRLPVTQAEQRQLWLCHLGVRERRLRLQEDVLWDVERYRGLPEGRAVRMTNRALVNYTGTWSHRDRHGDGDGESRISPSPSMHWGGEKSCGTSLNPDTT